jgi:polar amino acid transport system substrate-binding protein
MRTFILFLLIFLSAMHANAFAQTSSVRYAVPVWKNFTNDDATGVYPEMLSEIFKAKNLELKIITAPLHRAVAMVKSGEADMVGGVETSTLGSELVFSKYPIYSDSISALFKKDRLKDWKGLETIKAQATVSAGPSQMRASLGGNIPIQELNYRDQCIQMLIADRIHYYVELEFVLRRVFAHMVEKRKGSTFDLEERVIKLKNSDIDPNNYVIVPIKRIDLYMAFKNNEKGRTFEKIFNEGFVRLEKSGMLQQIYKKWDALPVMPHTP